MTAEIERLRKANLRLGIRLKDAEIQILGYKYAISLLRDGMGLEKDQEDLRECLMKFKEVKEKLDRYAIEHPSICYACGKEVPKTL